jgi:bacterioferritin
MQELNLKETTQLLSLIMEYELAGVVRYTHYSLMVTGPNRIPIVQFLKAQATESLLHAQQAGEILTGLGGHPSLKIAPIEESFKHSIYDILLESVHHESAALALYKELLSAVKDRSIYLEEYARGLIGQEELHSMELKKMLRDFHPDHATEGKQAS